MPSRPDIPEGVLPRQLTPLEVAAHPVVIVRADHCSRACRHISARHGYNVSGRHEVHVSFKVFKLIAENNEALEALAEDVRHFTHTAVEGVNTVRINKLLGWLRKLDNQAVTEG